MTQDLAIYQLRSTALTCSHPHIQPEVLRTALTSEHLSLVKSKPHRSVYYLAENSSLPGMYIKIFHPQRLRKQIELFFRVSHGRKEFLAASLLKRKQIPSITPVAYGKTLLPPYPGSVFISEEMRDAKPLNDCWNESSSSDERMVLISGYASLVARLHTAGIYHKDLYVDNVLVSNNRKENPEFSLVDFESVIPFAAYRKRTRLKNLVSAICSESNPLFQEEQTLHFLNTYFTGFHNRNASPGEIQQLTKEVFEQYAMRQAKREKPCIVPQPL